MIADMLARLIAAGADPRIAATVLVEAVEYGMIASATVRGQSADKADARREKDRARKRDMREKSRISKETAKANDVAAPKVSAKVSADMSADKADARCDLSSLSFLESQSFKGRKRESEKKKESQSRARATRMSADWQPSEVGWQFAVREGVADVRKLRDEFVDYWVGIPGQRGMKLDWEATWRNRVRAVTAGKRNGAGDRTIKGTAARSTFFDGLAEVAANIGGDGELAGAPDADIPLGRVNIDG